MDKIKTFEDACAAIGVSPNTVPDLSALPEADNKSMTAFYKLRIIAQALNEGWQPNWSDSNEWKWLPWFDEKKSGSGLSFDAADYWFTGTDVGSRLCFKSKQLCEYAAKQFADLYSDYVNN